LDNKKNIQLQSPVIEGIDFNTLRVVIRNNWFWLLLIFILINSVAYLAIRYTKNLYQSESELKLDIKKNASELGIKSVVEDQNVNVVSGEIEIIKSKLFLSHVIDSANLDVSYYSIGRLLNDELYTITPFVITRHIVTDHQFFNIPIYLEEKDKTHFTLTVGDQGKEVDAEYNKPVLLPGLDLIINRNNDFAKGTEIGYFFILNSHNVLLDYIDNRLEVEPINFNANTVRISFKDNNPAKAYAILNKIDTIYLQYSNEQKNLANKQKIDWVSNELAHIEKRMEGFENYFEDFTLQNKTNDLDDDLRITIATINRIDSQRYEMTRRVKDVNSLADGLNQGDFFISLSQRQFLPASLTKNLDILEQLYLDQEKLKLSYSEMTFAFREKQKEIEAIRGKALAQLNELKADALRKLQEFNQRKIQLENTFATLPDKSTQFSKNLRFYKLYEQFYLSLMQSKSEFEIAQAGSIPDFKILSPATMPGYPISPDKWMITGIGFVMSIVTMLFFVGALYLLNNKITSITELERNSEVPVLGVVPSSRYPDGTGLHIIDHPKSMVSEAIRTLRTNLDFFNVNSNQKVIAISSTVSGEGKSFIAMNLGGVMALSKKKVVLLDLDMRKPKVNLPTSIDDKSKGVSTILIRKHNWQECITKTQQETFDYIASGPHPPNPSELLLNGAFEGLLDDLKKNYDYIILDTPPVGLVTDGIMAMRRADISVYVFRANYSKKDFLNNLQRIIKINKFSAITTLLNALPSTGENSYGYGYYEEPKRGNWIRNIFKT
jgi:tyrosine-protein kinase Etk/Wzc